MGPANGGAGGALGGPAENGEDGLAVVVGGGGGAGVITLRASACSVAGMVSPAATCTPL